MDTLFEFVIGSTTLGLNGVLVANVVHVDTLLVDGSVSHMIGLLKDGRSQLLLPLTESVYIGGACIDRLGHASRCLPVCSGAHGVSLSVPVIIGPLTVHVAASEDAGLELRVLFVACVVTVVLVAAFCCLGIVHAGLL